LYIISLQAGEAGAEQLPKVGAAFSRFLEDASGFYRTLVMQLQGCYGDVGVKLDLPSGAAKRAAMRAPDQETVRAGQGLKRRGQESRIRGSKLCILVILT
jgi:hypothetical protein